MNPILVDVIGYLAGTCAVIITLPQIYKVLKTRKVKDIAIWTIILLMLTSFLYVVYGILINSMPLIVTDTIAFILEAILLGLKVYFDCNSTEKN
jgi:MtN3 and saliva related transmembrane protein